MNWREIGSWVYGYRIPGIEDVFLGDRTSCYHQQIDAKTIGTLTICPDEISKGGSLYLTAYSRDNRA